LIIAENMSTTKSTSDGWGPYGPPSTWKIDYFNKEYYDEYVARRDADLKANPGQPPRVLTAMELLELADKKEREMMARSQLPFRKQ